MTKKTWLAAAGCVCSLAVNGMPTQAALKNVESIVKEVMRSDISDFKAEKKSADDVAASALKYAEEAKTEAARFLLLKGAFFYRVRAANYDGAIDVVSKMRQDIDDVPDATLVKILSNAVKDVSRKSCPRLHDLHRRLQNRVRSAQKVMELEAKIKTNPSEKSLRIALGEQYAMLGEWDKALPEFAAGTTRLAKVAALERRADTKPCDVADAWWEASGADGSDLSLAYRIHAAKFYRKAIADGSLSGLKKAVVEKRLAEVKTDDFSAEQVAATPLGMKPGKASLRPKSLVLDLGDGVKMEMVGCPKGKGMLWPNTNCTFEITRPFWFGKYPVTVAEWERLMPPATPPAGVDRKNLDPKIPIQHYSGSSAMSRKEVEEFTAKLTQKFRRQIPAGYVFRLPTNAEWVYAAVRADNSALQKIFMGEPESVKHWPEYFVQFDECVKYWDARGCKSPYDSKFLRSAPYIPVGSKRPNAWGIYDLFGPTLEPWLLTYPYGKRMFFQGANRGCHSNYARDPMVFDGKGGTTLGGFGFHDGRTKFGAQWINNNFSSEKNVKLRLVVGPDLLKERGVKLPGFEKMSSE